MFVVWRAAMHKTFQNAADATTTLPATGVPADYDQIREGELRRPLTSLWRAGNLEPLQEPKSRPRTFRLYSLAFFCFAPAFLVRNQPSELHKSVVHEGA